jgi:LysM repeat protein
LIFTKIFGKSFRIMKPTLLFATLSMVLASPVTFAKSELETLRSRCSEQERQIQQLENENARLRSGGTEARTPIAKTETAATKSTSSSSSTSTYTVQAGDSMEKIARKVGANADKLAKANGMDVNSIIRPGQKLKVPGVAAPASPMVSVAPTSATKSLDKTHKVQQGETFSSISKKHGISADSLVAANPKVKPTALRPGQIVNLSSTGGSTTMISTSPSRPKTPTAEPKAPAPVAKSPEVRQSAPATKPAPAPSPAPESKPTPETTQQAVVENAAPSPTPEKKIRPITIEGEMTYGEFAAKHGTDAERLNALNGLDLTTATVLAKGSELYVPAQP